MSADLLDRATQALRCTTGSTPEQLERGLERLERSAPRLRPGVRRGGALAPRHFRTLAWTVAIMLLGVGAWASATGRVRWFEVAPAPPGAAPVAPAPPPERPRAPSVVPPPAPSDPAPPAPEPARPAPEPAPEPLPARARPRSAPVTPVTPAPVREDADALYRAAHEAHFVRGDDAAALAAWDRYLAAAEPGHRWRLEASYNRGIALYRLGQSRAARRALEPFARGDYGSYRRAEAQRLIATLPAD